MNGDGYKQAYFAKHYKLIKLGSAMDKNNKHASRRNFLKQATKISVSGAAVNALGLSSMLIAQQALADEQAYKALVYVFLAGGNDSFNLLAPRHQALYVRITRLGVEKLPYQANHYTH